MNDPSSSDTEYLFKLPKRLDSMSDTAYISLKLAAISDRLSLENRTLVNHDDGRAENVAEHSLMLAIIGPVIAERLYPDLDTNLVARFATIHDLVEAYVGDTPTHNIDSAGIQKKLEKETRGLSRLRLDFADSPELIKLLSDYETQKIAEARFIRVLDKCMPILLHFLEGGKTLRSYMTPAGALKNSHQRAQALRKEYPEYTKLINIRIELSKLAATNLFN